MNVKFDFPIPFGDRTVYVREVPAAELPPEIQAQIEADHPVYAIHDKDGQRLALARDRNIAFAIARTNEFAPVSVH